MSSSLQYKKPTASPDLRQRVFSCIDKLSDRATLQQASSELQFIAANLTVDSLPTFLNSISTVDSSSKSVVRVHVINLLPVLSRAPHVVASYLPKISSFLLRRLRDGDSAVRAACVDAAGALSPVGFPVMFAGFMGAVLSEQEGGAQIGACLCLKAAVDAAAQGVVGEAEEGEMRRLLPRMVRMAKGEGFKAKAAMLGLIGSVVGVNGGAVVNGRGGLVGSVVTCAVEMLRDEDWAARKAAAEVLETVARTLEGDAAAEFKRFCVTSLEARRFDKVKITRETMNRALDAWREVPGGPDDDLLLSRSNSSVSKGGVSPSISRRSSFAGIETPKSKKSITKTRSSLSDSLFSSTCPSPSVSSSNASDIITTPPPLETKPQRKKKTISKSRSSLSDDSTITDSSSVSKGSHDHHHVGYETLETKKKPGLKTRSSLPNDSTIKPTKRMSTSKSVDSKLIISTWKAETTKAECEYDGVKVESDEKFGEFRSGFHEAGYVEEDDRGSEETGESNVDVEDLSVIRDQLFQIERQQSNLLDLLQRFMGNSQNGIDSLETRVTGLEKALDEISYDLAIQSGRIPKNDHSSGSSTTTTTTTTCCPSTEFLSPKFWRKTEGKPSKFTYMGEPMQLQQRDGPWLFQDQNEGSTKTMKSTQSPHPHHRHRHQHQGRTCSPRSLDVPSAAPFVSPVVNVRGV